MRTARGADARVPIAARTRVPAGTSGSIDWVRTALIVVRAVLPRPTLWVAGLAAALRLARPRWWQSWPPLPLPDESYWRFRLITAYGGSGDALPRRTDVVAYLRWCQRARRGRD